MGANATDAARSIIEVAVAALPSSAGVIDVESVSITRAGRRDLVRVVVDRDGGIDLDAVAEVSRAIADALDAPDAAAALPGPYVLEVTSPGVDRPLTQPKHWRRSLQRLVRITRTGQPDVEGRIVAVDEAAASILVAGDPEPVRVPFAEVDRAVVQVEFNPDAADQDDRAQHEDDRAQDEGDA